MQSKGKEIIKSATNILESLKNTSDGSSQKLQKLRRLGKSLFIGALYVSVVSETMQHMAPRVHALPTGYDLNLRTVGENQTSAIVPQTIDVPINPYTTSSMISLPTDAPQAKTKDGKKGGVDSGQIEKLCYIMDDDEELGKAINHLNKEFMKHLKYLCQELRESQDCDQENSEIEEKPLKESQQPEASTDLAVSLANMSASLQDMKSLLVDLQSTVIRNTSFYREFAMYEVMPDLRYMHLAFEYLISASNNMNTSLSRIESSLAQTNSSFERTGAALGNIESIEKNSVISLFGILCILSLMTGIMFRKMFFDDRHREKIKAQLNINNDIRANDIKTETRRSTRDITNKLQQIEREFVNIVLRNNHNRNNEFRNYINNRLQQMDRKINNRLQQMGAKLQRIEENMNPPV